MTTHPKGPAIEVPQEIIATACRRDSSHCMVAEAIKEAWPWASHVSVDLQTIRVTDRERKVRIGYLTPRKVQIAIINFDQGNLIEPFSFTLRRPHISPMQQRYRAPPPPAKRQSSKMVTYSHGGHKDIVATVGRRLPAVTIGRRRTFGIKALEK